MEYIKAKTMLTKCRDSSWFGTNYNMNIYKGCCHGCIYCDSRSECYRIEEFDKVRAKKDSLLLLRNELQRKIRTGIIGFGAMSDPYNPFEQELELTRHSLELVDAYGFGAAIATKSPLITRDTDILQSIAEHSPVICKITVTAADDELSKKVEPNASPSSKRMNAIKQLSESGIFSGILLMPVLPFIEDNEKNITAIVDMAADSGAKFIYPAFGMTLRGNQRKYYYDRLDEIYPDGSIKEKYIKYYSGKYKCVSLNVKKLWTIFTERCSKYGILYNMKDIVASAKLPYAQNQLSLF